jgi:hypothetical protein
MGNFVIFLFVPNEGLFSYPDFSFKELLSTKRDKKAKYIKYTGKKKSLL